jgi:hypothetical protein
MNVSIVLRSGHATEWVGEADAFAAINSASADYPEWSFRLRSGGEPGRYRIEAFKIASSHTGWLAFSDETLGENPDRLHMAA